MNKKTKIGIIGLGYWGPNLVRNFIALSEETEVLIACDLLDKNLEKIKNNYPKINLTKNYKEVLSNSRIDAVAIATPVATHHQLAKESLEQGKHVLVEKPMTSTVKESEELINLAKNKGLILMVDHTFLYTGAVRKIKEIIDSGKLGNIYYFDSERINLGLIQSDVNVIWDLAPHDISIMNYLLKGQPLSVQAIGSNYYGDLKEIAHLIVKYSNDLIGHIHVSWLSPIKIRKVLIGGSKKMILYNDVEPVEKIKVYDRKIDINLKGETPTAPIYRSGDIYIPDISDKEPLFKECKHFINCIKNKKKPLTDGRSGLETVKILEATNESLKKGKEIYLK